MTNFLFIYSFEAHYGNYNYEGRVRVCINFSIRDITIEHCELLLVVHLGIYKLSIIRGAGPKGGVNLINGRLIIGVINYID